MWYFNDDFIHESGYTLVDADVLQLIHQNRSEDKSNSIAMYANDDMLEKFSDKELITTVQKKTKKDSDFSILRLTKKGSDLLDCFGTPSLTVGDKEMFEYLCGMYLRHDDKDRVIGNKKRTREYCAVFRQTLSLTLHEMYYLCELFLSEFPYTKRLEYIFFNSNKHRYGKYSSHFEDGSLYQYLDENREKVEKYWDKYVKDR